MHSTLRFLDPRVRSGLRWAHYHAMLLLLIVGLIVAFAFGVFAGVQYNAHYFRQHYAVPLRAPRAGRPVPKPHVSVPASYHLNLAYMPPVGDQGPLGSCQAWAADYYQLSYLANVKWHREWGRRRALSPKYGYVQAGNGSDSGSWFGDDVSFIPSIGIPRFGQYPYPPYTLPTRAEIPADVYAEAAQHRFPVSYTMAFSNPGAGMGGVDAFKALMIQTGSPGNLAIDVYNGFFNATNTDGWVPMPPSSEQSAGGHAVTITGWDDNLVHDGLRGWFFGVNQWSRAFGGTSTLQHVDAAGNNGGYFALPYAYVAAHAWYAGVLQVNWHSGHVAPSVARRQRSGKPWVNRNPPPNDQFGRPPVTVSPRRRPHLAANAPVHGVVTRDTGVDISGLINHVAAAYGLPPVGLAAVVGVESGVHQYADRFGYWCDVSFGATQETVCTAAGYGVGNGEDTQANVDGVRVYEDNLTDSVWLAGLLLHNFTAESCTNLLDGSGYVAWNAGPGYGCHTSWYWHPTGQAYSNEQNYLGWLAYAERYWAYTPAPRPKPRPPVFHQKRWGWYRWAHHERPVSAYAHHRLTWQASIWTDHQHECGSVLSAPHFYRAHRRGHHSFSEQRFQFCTVVTSQHTWRLVR